ncbi:MAG: ankyrin repeat domain-containing protein, partial [Desulfovibrionales bacterium]|nr:ankyrin repeat domain-containing protein [Desulfovibrionales bacterium]
RSLDGWSVLMIAASKGHTGTVRVLLDAGARVNYVDHDYGWSALMWAVSKGHITTVITLLEAQAQVDIHTKRSGDTPLHEAIRENHPVLVTLLLQANAEPAPQNYLGKTPLNIPLTSQYNPGIDILFWETTRSSLDTELRKKLFGTNIYGEHTLHQSIRDGDNKSVVECLKKHPQFLDRPRTDGCTPLHIAVLHNNVEALALLLRHKISLSPTIEDKDTPLQWALQLERERMVDILGPAIATASPDKTAEIDREWLRQNSPLSLPVWTEHVIRISYSADQIRRFRLPSKSIARIVGTNEIMETEDDLSASEVLESNVKPTPYFNRQELRTKL